VFAWGVADAEELNYKDLQEVWKYYKKDPDWGTAVWCMKKRGQMPQGPVEKRIRDKGIWDLDAFAKEHKLKVNFYDTANKVYATGKYKEYAAWAITTGREVLPYDRNWWNGWKEYEKENPDWMDAQWYKDLDVDRDVEIQKLYAP